MCVSLSCLVCPFLHFYYRRVTDVKARFMNSIVMGLILGIIYYGQTDTQRSAKNIMGLFFLLIMFQTMVSMFGVLQVRHIYSFLLFLGPIIQVTPSLLPSFSLSIHRLSLLKSKSLFVRIFQELIVSPLISWPRLSPIYPTASFIPSSFHPLSMVW